MFNPKDFIDIAEADAKTPEELGEELGAMEEGISPETIELEDEKPSNTTSESSDTEPTGERIGSDTDTANPNKTKGDTGYNPSESEVAATQIVELLDMIIPSGIVFFTGEGQIPDYKAAEEMKKQMALHWKEFYELNPNFQLPLWARLGGLIGASYLPNGYNAFQTAQKKKKEAAKEAERNNSNPNKHA